MASFKTDRGGVAFKSSDIKLCCNASTWGTRLSQYHRHNGIVRIITYTLPRLEYIRGVFEKRPNGIFIVCHEKHDWRAKIVKRHFPDIRLAVNAEVHSKVVLVAPVTVWVTSANFGSSRWHETSMGVHSKRAHDWYVENSFNPLWKESAEITEC